jgi:hypothetical protein
LALFVEVRFHPVGQGLCVSGTFVSGLPKTEFTFVYDCGSTAKFPIERETARISERTGNIGLLCISHFDKDHVSGLERLLQKSPAKCVVLPYVRISQRIHWLLMDNAMGFYRKFLIDPAAAILSVSPKSRVVFIAGSGDKPVLLIEDISENSDSLNQCPYIPDGQGLPESEGLFLTPSQRELVTLISDSHSLQIRSGNSFFTMKCEIPTYYMD